MVTVSALPTEWLAGLSLLGAACLASLLFLLIRGDAGTRRRQRLLRARLDRLDHPALISGINGKVEWANRALCSTSADAGGAGRADVAARLAGAARPESPSRPSRTRGTKAPSR